MNKKNPIITLNETKIWALTDLDSFKIYLHKSILYLRGIRICALKTLRENLCENLK